jgi:hypothetical protein
MKEENQERTFLFLRYVPEKAEVLEFIERGYFLVIFDKELARELVHWTEVQGKWMPLEMLPQEIHW